MTSSDHYRKVEEEFEYLMSSLPALTESERAEVAHFIDVREYGLALETLVGILVEEGKRASPEAIERIRSLASLMALKDSPALGFLQSSKNSS